MLCDGFQKRINYEVTPLPTDVEITVPRTDVFAGDSIQATAKFTSESGVPCQDVE
ncbi:MAG: arrestin family protein [Mycoplasmoidaceae bacterium]|nr:arrestin family protein [Mycoplasmoidaceae bacterium]